MIMPWDLKAEIREQLSYIKEWDGRFVVAYPGPHRRRLILDEDRRPPIALRGRKRTGLRR